MIDVFVANKLHHILSPPRATSRLAALLFDARHIQLFAKNRSLLILTSLRRDENI